MLVKETANKIISQMSFSASKSYNTSTGQYDDIPTNPHYIKCALAAVDIILDTNLNSKDRVFYQEVRREIKNKQ